MVNFRNRRVVEISATTMRGKRLKGRVEEPLEGGARLEEKKFIAYEGVVVAYTVVREKKKLTYERGVVTRVVTASESLLNR